MTRLRKQGEIARSASRVIAPAVGNGVKLAAFRRQRQCKFATERQVRRNVLVTTLVIEGDDRFEATDPQLKQYAPVCLRGI